jgi:large subunit ribosomal protein L9
VTSGDIAEFLKSKGIELDKRKIQLDEAIKKLGEHEVKIRLHPEVQATIKLLVSKEG